MEREKTEPELPVLFVLDEFSVLGYMQTIEMAAGLMAGFGVKLWPIVQNIGQLKKHYSDSWETFVANAGVVTAFGVSDDETVKVLTELLGQTGITEKMASGVTDSGLYQGGVSEHDKPQNLPLLAKHELRVIFGRKKNRVLIFNVEDDPAIAERFTYYEKGSMFDGHYDPDPKRKKSS